MSFANLKSSRGSSIDKLVKAAEAVSTPKTESNSYDDDRFWKPTRDKAGNGFAVIRFLPGQADAPTPWVRYWDHAFKGPSGQWYIEKSLTTLNKKDPVSIIANKPILLKKILVKFLPKTPKILKQ